MSWALRVASSVWQRVGNPDGCAVFAVVEDLRRAVVVRVWSVDDRPDERAGLVVEIDEQLADHRSVEKYWSVRDEREVDRRGGKVLCRLEPAEPAAYDAHPMPLSWRASALHPVPKQVAIGASCGLTVLTGRADDRSRYSPASGTPLERQGPDAGM
jgi:hypothetical protein